MSNIKLLDQHTINKIAAGEVVERPSSVVKELVENSIDAESSAITVEIKEGGMSLIRITDNGNGIAKEDIKTAFIRHSTSKIKRIEDLITVSSLGFRGEALASIAAVAQVEIISKTKTQVTGIRYQIQGGNEKSIEEIGCPEGTTILVRNLFYNTPARRKFLKAPGTEAGYISELINKLSLSNPHISFKFIYNNQVKLHTSGNNQLQDVIFNIYGKDIAKNVIKINHRESNVSISGFIGKPQVSRSNRNYQNYYINGRYIKSKLIQKALEEGYKTYLPIHKHPFCVLHISLDMDVIDVNVHPNKMELRFKNREDLYRIIVKVIQGALKEQELIPEVTFDSKKKGKKPIFEKTLPEPFEKKLTEKVKSEAEYKSNIKELNISKNNLDKKNVDYNICKESTINENINIEKKESDIKPSIIKDENRSYTKSNNEQLLIDEPLLSEKSLPYYQIIGQLFNTYWIVEFKEKYYIIDQHAAHEKVLFEKIMRNIKESKANSQQIMPPIVVHTSLKEQEIIKQHQDVFIKVGFEIEAFGGDSYAIRAVPYILSEIKGEFFLEMVDLLADERYNVTHDVLIEKVAMISCKAAVKGNSKMSFIEIKKLIEQLLSLENPYTCPHGRPTIISMTRYELEKKFKRIQ